MSREPRFRAIEPVKFDDNEKSIEFIMSTEARDGYGEVVKQNWRLDRFNSNPVFLWAHNSREMPIGRMENVRVEDGALRGKAIFADADINENAPRVYRAYKTGILRGGSVGFLPHTIKREKIDDVDVTVLDDNELFEFSATPVPANPEALAEMAMKIFGDNLTITAGTRDVGSHSGDLKLVPGTSNTFELSGTTTERGNHNNNEDKMEELIEVKAALTESKMNLERATRDLEKVVKERDALNERCKTLEIERAAQQGRADKAEGEIIKKDLEGLIGKKITANEVDGLVELASINRDLYERQMDAIRARADMNIVTDGSVMGDEPATKAAPSLVERINARN